eukprot:9594855-Ditylum_brightwellii.AAC.1
MPKVPKEKIEFLQAVVSTSLWYAQAVDLIILPALKTIVSQQAVPTEVTIKETDHLLDYLASNMILYIHSGAAYMVLPEACSRAG